MKEKKSVFCYVNEVAFVMPPSNLREVLVAQGTNLVVRGFTLSATSTPAPPSGRGEGMEI